MISDFRRDVSNPDATKAETVAYESLLDYFKGTGIEVVDTRDQHITWDFILRRGDIEERIDVKFDNFYERSKRVPFEIGNVTPSGPPTPKWGVHPKLDWVILVPWSFTFTVLMPLQAISRLVAFSLSMHGAQALEETYNWSLRSKPNRSGYTTKCWVIPEEQVNGWLEKYGMPKMRVLPTREEHHRHPPRLILNGKEVA